MTGVPAHKFFEATDERRYDALSQPRKPRFAVSMPDLPEDRVTLDVEALRRLCPGMTDGQIDRAYVTGVGFLPKRPPRWQVESAAVALGVDPHRLIKHEEREEPIVTSPTKPKRKAGPAKTCACGYTTTHGPAFVMHQRKCEHADEILTPIPRPKCSDCAHRRGPITKGPCLKCDIDTRDCFEPIECDLPCSSVDPCNGTDCTRDDDPEVELTTTDHDDVRYILAAMMPHERVMCRELIDTHLRLISAELQAILVNTHPALVCSIQDRLERVCDLVREVAS